MKRKTIALLLFVLATSYLLADSWKVLSVSSPDIKVGGKVVRIGSVISGDANFTWPSNKGDQWVKLAGKGGKIKLISMREMEQKKVSTIDQLTNTKPLVGRNVELLNDVDMRNFFAQPIVLQDSLILHVPYNLDKQHVLFLQYDNNINKVLPGCGSKVTIDDRIFMLDGKPTTPVTRTYRLYYYDMIENTTHLIADSLVIDVDQRLKLRQ